MSALPLSLHDAATNCDRDGGIATLTLKSGVQFVGKLKKDNFNLHLDGATVHARVPVAKLASVKRQIQNMETWQEENPEKVRAPCRSRA